MPTREQVRKNRKPLINPRSPRPAVQALKTEEQSPHPAALLKRAELAPGSLTSRDARHLQHSIGNRSTGRLLAGPARKNETGLPENLKAGIEALSGVSLDDVQVHYHSPKPVQMEALAYTQGSDIHLSAGQEKHLAHEAWHVVQQKQGRVKPTVETKKGSVNDSDGLENEAEVMGNKAQQMKTDRGSHSAGCGCPACSSTAGKGGLQDARPGHLHSQAKQPGPEASGGVIQRVCAKCGSNKHSTNACPVSKKDRDEHEQQVKAFKAAKQKTLETLKGQEESSGKKKGKAGTGAFLSKHVASPGLSLDKSSKKVASTRTWGERTSGKSTVIGMSDKDIQKESRYQVEGLKFSEANITDSGVAPKFGVNKPTKFDYPTKTSTVTSDSQGKRDIKEGQVELAKPVLGMQGTKIHHLEGVKKEDGEE